MNSLATKAAAGFIAVIFGLVAFLPSAQAKSSSTPAAVASDVVAFRQNIGNVLQSYFTTYGSRLSTNEQAQMTTLVGQVDRELATLQRKAQHSAELTRTHAPKAKQRAAAHAAAQTFDAAYSHALASLESVQPILQPKLSLFEALRAKSDLDQSLQAFENLGTQLHTLAQ